MKKEAGKLSCLKLAEVACWSAGLILCAAFVSQVVLGEVRRTDGIAEAEMNWSRAPAPLLSALPGGAETVKPTLETPDQALWSRSRVAAWQESVERGPRTTLAVLDIPEIGLEVPVFSGRMDRGPVWIQGTALPGETGNVGISGHRDGYFRSLKDAAVGQALLLRTPAGETRYRIDDIRIVDPIDVEVLDPTDEPTITLVTCYPFYFLGSAPQRFIVRARMDEPANLALSENKEK